MLSEDMKERYMREILVPEVGENGVLKLRESSVAVIGCGALGGLTAMMLAGAGVGSLVIADFDTVGVSNLHRQLFFSTADAGMKKGDVLRQRMLALNPDAEVEYIDAAIDFESACAIASRVDILIDASDNADTKYTLERAAATAEKPFIVGGVKGFHGQAMTCLPDTTPFSAVCLPPGNVEKPSAPLGVMAPAPGLISSVLAAEAIKLLIGIGQPLTDRLLTFDLLSGTFAILPLAPGNT